MTSNNAPIPLVSFAPFLQGSATQRVEVAQQVYQAFHDVGFLYLADCGIGQDRVDRIFEISAKFFALPQALKSSYALRDPSVNQGYTANGAEGVNDEGVGDHKECYEHRRYCNDLCPTPFEMSAEDVSLKDFKSKLDEFYQECFTLSLQVLRCLAIAMKLPGGEDYFEKITKRADPQLRLLHYPPVAASQISGAGEATGKGGRINAHTDFGLCTLLWQDSVGGLEVDPFHTGDFKAARPIPGTVLINIGDLLVRLLNGRVKSTMHRVVSPPHTSNASGETMLPARYSMPFFVHPDPDTVVDPIVLSEGEEKKFESVIAGDWRDYNTAKNYGMKEQESSLRARLGMRVM